MVKCLLLLCALASSNFTILRFDSLQNSDEFFLHFWRCTLARLDHNEEEAEEEKKFAGGNCTEACKKSVKVFETHMRTFKLGRKSS